MVGSRGCAEQGGVVLPPNMQVKRRTETRGLLSEARICTCRVLVVSPDSVRPPAAEFLRVFVGRVRSRRARV